MYFSLAARAESVPLHRLRGADVSWDYYDVAGPDGGTRDGVVDLANDILGVIRQVQP